MRSLILKSIYFKLLRLSGFGNTAAFARQIGRFSLMTEIERRLDCWSWQVDGIQYWPLVRTELRRHIMRSRSSVSPAPRPQTATPSVAAAAEARLSEAEIRSHWNEVFASEVKCEVLFLSRVEDNNQRVADKIHDRMIDPLLRFARASGRTAAKVLVSRRRLEISSSLAIGGTVVFIDEYNNLEGTTSRTKPLENLFGSLSVSDHSYRKKTPEIQSLIKRTRQRELVFGCLLDRVTPKVVFLATFDDPVQMAMTLACHRRNIQVVDVQHGKQGDDHLLGIEWANFPSERVELIPDYFWVWSKTVKTRITKSLGRGAQLHRPICGGNLWLEEWHSGYFGDTVQVRSFAAQFASFSPKLLVCLQPIADPLPPALINAMEKAPSEWIWWIRLHPKQHVRKDEFKAMLAERAISFEMDRTSDLPLFPLLGETDCHLTAWSTVAFEAEARGVPTVLCHPIASEVLSKEIAEGRFAYAQDARSILDRVTDAISKRGQRSILPPTIEFSRASAEKCFEEITNSYDRPYEHP